MTKSRRSAVRVVGVGIVAVVVLVILMGGAVPNSAAAAAGDLITINDPADFFKPEGDIRQVGVGDGGGGSLLFTMQVEKYTDPFTDPSWANQDTLAEWNLGTGGRALTVTTYIYGGKLRAGVFEGDALVCPAVATADAATRTYSAKVIDPGCFGDVKRPTVIGVFHYENHRRVYDRDMAPDDGPVPFDRPAAGQATGGYAVVDRRAGFERFGAIAPGTPSPATPAGTFARYTGASPVVGVASARQYDPALWAVTEDGKVLTQDGAEFYGDARDIKLDQPIVGIAVRSDRSGYWLVARDGGIFSFGRALFFGSTGGIKLNKPVVGMAATTEGDGYWLVASDGGIFSYGNSGFHGSTGDIALEAPVVGMARMAGAAFGYQQGYWLVARDGGIFAFGVPFYGSAGATALHQPIVGMAVTRSGAGYRFIARDGGVFGYGDAEFHGSGATAGRTDVIGLATA